jgi:hypothetical protein
VADRRTALGSERGLGWRTYVFLSRDAVEMDEVDGFNVVRSRVLLDDVLCVTLHKRPPWGLFISALLVVAFIIFCIAVLPGGADNPLTWLPFFVPLAVVLLVSVLFGVTYVTVYGRRSRARMAYWLRSGRARAVFELLLERVAQRQAPGGGPQEASSAAPLEGGGSAGR